MQKYEFRYKKISSIRGEGGTLEQKRLRQSLYRTTSKGGGDLKNFQRMDPLLPTTKCVWKSHRETSSVPAKQF